MNRWMRRAAAVLSIAMLTACEDDPTSTVRVAQVEVGPADQVLVVGDSTTITAVPMTADGDVVVEQVVWRNLRPDIATVVVNGGSAVVTARAPGVARIEAEAGGRTGFVNITVQAAAQVATVTMLPATLVLEAGQDASLEAVARTAGGEIITGRAVTWTVEGQGVLVTPAAVSGWATVSAQLYGNATVRATIDGITGEAEVQVVTTAPPPAQVATVEISPSSFSLPVNHETPLQAIAKDANGAIISGRPVTWTSSADPIASITPIGVSQFASLLAKVPGEAVIRATVDGISGEITVQVTTLPPPPQVVLYLSFYPHQRGIWVNQVLDFSQHLVAMGRDGRIEDPQVTWTVEDPSIAVVDQNGNVRGLSKGTTEVRASVGDSLHATALVTVFASAQGPQVFDLTYDWWDGQWHMAPTVGTEQWTDPNGTVRDVQLWAIEGTLTLTGDGAYERVMVLHGWAVVNGVNQVVIQRPVVDSGTYTILVGGATGYSMQSTTTPGYTYTLLPAYNAGHATMRAAVGTAAEQDYLFRMRQ